MGPYIAKDTGEPLVVMGGYRVAADGSLLRDPVAHRPPASATAEDIALLEAHGLEGLKALGLWGVVDRLSRRGD